MVNPKLYTLFESVEEIGHRLCCCKVPNGPLRIYTEQGKLVSVRDYSVVHPFSDGVARVCAEDAWGLINKTGKEAVKPKYSFIYVGIDKDWIVGIHGEGMGVIDTTGKVKIPLIYHDIARSESCYKVSVRTNWETCQGILSKDGKVLIPPQYEAVDMISQELVKFYHTNNKWGVLNINGRVVLKPEFDRITYDKNAHIVAKQDIKTIYFTDTGRIADHFSEYEEVGDLGTGGIMAGRKGDKWRLIDKSGRPMSGWLDTVNGLTNRRPIK